MGGDYDEEDQEQESIIPGDNDKLEPPHEFPLPVNPDAPGNLTAIPAYGGDIPNVVEPTLRGK